MILHRRKHGSQRAMQSIKVEIWPSGYGDVGLHLKGADGIWYWLKPETPEEVKALMSEAHITHHNWKQGSF